MLDESILDGINSIVAIVALVTYIVGARARKDIRRYMYIYITAPFATIFEYFGNFYPIAISISQVCYALLVVGMVYALLKEELELHGYRVENTLVASPAFSLVILQFAPDQVAQFSLVAVIIGIILEIISFHVAYLRRTIYHAIIVVLTGCSTLAALASHLNYVNVPGAKEFSYTMYFFAIIVLMISGLVALLETRLLESESRYRSAYEYLKLFKGIFTHDMSNVINNIQLLVDLERKYKADNMDEDVSAMLEKINMLVERASRMVKNMQKISKMPIGPVELENVDLVKILEESIASLAEPPGKKIDIRFTRPGEKLLVKANSLLAEVFNNILMNAVKHNENEVVEIGIEVFVEHSRSTKQVEIRISDNGVGIPENFQDQLFSGKPITNGSPGKGLGIGLGLTRRCVELFGGSIHAEHRVPGKPGEGSVFIVRLPLSS